MNKEEILSTIDEMIKQKPKGLVLNHLLISNDWHDKIKDSVVNGKYKGLIITSSEYIEKDKATITKGSMVERFNKSVEHFLNEA